MLNSVTLLFAGEKQSWAEPPPGSVKIATPVNPVATPPYSAVKAQIDSDGESETKFDITAAAGGEKTPLTNDEDGSRKRYGSNKSPE